MDGKMCLKPIQPAGQNEPYTVGVGLCLSPLEKIENKSLNSNASLQRAAQHGYRWHWGLPQPRNGAWLEGNNPMSMVSIREPMGELERDI